MFRVIRKPASMKQTARACISLDRYIRRHAVLRTQGRCNSTARAPRTAQHSTAHSRAEQSTAAPL
jgi:hypothetical protein